MTSGIYKLTFANGDEYVGKSNHIEKRWEEHRTSFLRNKAAAKMMNAYHKYGMPEFKTLMVAHKDHIDILESYYISCERPSLNSVIAKCIDHGDFEMLMENQELLEISTVQHIAEIVDSKETIDECIKLLHIQKNQLDELRVARSKEEIEATCYARLKDEVDVLQSEVTVGDKVISDLLAKIEYLELPWWKKLFR
jgi:hypothetical protein